MATTAARTSVSDLETAARSRYRAVIESCMGLAT